ALTWQPASRPWTQRGWPTPLRRQPPRPEIRASRRRRAAWPGTCSRWRTISSTRAVHGPDVSRCTPPAVRAAVLLVLAGHVCPAPARAQRGGTEPLRKVELVRL